VPYAVILFTTEIIEIREISRPASDDPILEKLLTLAARCLFFLKLVLALSEPPPAC
jgi:hypothetical protein